jgi:uncharacterized membrane protein
VHHAGVPVVEVRLLSVAFGGILVLIVFSVAATVVPAGHAAAAAALVAVGFEPFVHGAELRSYELLALMAAALSLVLIFELRRSRPWLEVALALIVVAGLLTHYFFAYSLLGAVAWLWLDPRARMIRMRATLAIAVGCLGFLPWLRAFLAQYHHDRFWWIGRYSSRLVLVTPLRLLAPLGTHHLGLGLFLLAIIAGGAVSATRRAAEGALVASLAVLPVAAAAAVWASGERTYAVRNLIEAAPYTAILAIAGAATLPRRASTTLAAAIVATVGIGWWAEASLPPPPYRLVAEALVAHGWRASDPIGVHGNFFAFRAPLEWYLPHRPVLEVARATKRRCGEVFVIVPTRNNTFTVRREASGIRLPKVTLLATRLARGCVRLTTNPRLQAIN